MMESTRIISPGMGSNADATRVVSYGMDPGRTMAGVSPFSLALSVITGNQYALATRNSTEHLVAQIDASGAAMGRRLPLNLCLVIDRSGSMEGEPLQYMKQACGHVVDLLDDADILSVVTFEDRADVVMPARRVMNKGLIKEHINRIQPGNTTNLFDGLVAGASQVASVMSNQYLNRVVVLTDGEPTSGVKDYSSIVGVAAEQRTRGITTSALGFGPEFNEELLVGLARRGSGNYHYISRPELIPDVFRQELEQLLTTVARNIRLRLVLSRWVDLRQVYGHQPVLGHRTVEVTLPDLDRGTSMRTLFELGLGRRPAGSYRVARVELHYEDCTQGSVQQQVSGDAVFHFVNDPALVSSGVNGTVQNEIQLAQASKNLERTMMGLRTQQLSAMHVMADLQRTQMLLSQSGMENQAAELGQAIHGLQTGAVDVEKTLIGTVMNIDSGRRQN